MSRNDACSAQIMAFIPFTRALSSFVSLTLVEPMDVNGSRVSSSDVILYGDAILYGDVILCRSILPEPMDVNGSPKPPSHVI